MTTGTRIPRVIPERRRSQFFSSFSLSPRTNKLPQIPQTSADATSLARTDPFAFLYTTLAQIHPTTDLDHCRALVTALVQHITSYDLSLRCQRDVFRTAWLLLQSNDPSIVDAGYDMLNSLSRDCPDTAEVLRCEILQSVWLLRTTYHKIRRPAFLTALFKNGRDISGFEASSLTILMNVVQDCLDMYQRFDRMHSLDEGHTQRELDGHMTSLTELQQVYHKALQLTCGVIKQGKGLDQYRIPELVQQVGLMIKSSDVDDDADQLLRIFDALLTSGSVVSDKLLPTMVRSICNVHGYDDPEKHTVSIDQAWLSFQTLARTHLDQYGVNLIMTILNEGSRLHDCGPQESFGALRILGKILAEPHDQSVIDLDALIYSFKQASNPWNPEPSHKDRLYLLKLFVERDHLKKLLLGAPDWRELTSIILEIAESCGEESASIPDILMRLDALDLSDTQRDALDILLLKLGRQIPEQVAGNVQNRYQRPLNAADAYDRVHLIVQGFVKNPSLAISLRLKGVDILMTTCLDFQLRESPYLLPCIEMLFGMLSVDDLEVDIHARLVDLALDLHVQSDSDQYFGQVVDLLCSVVQRPTEPAVSTHASNAARGLVRLFMHSMHTSAKRSQLLYDNMLDLIASDSQLDPAAHVALLRLFFRLRSDANYRLYLVNDAEGEAMAATLCRSKKANDRMLAKPLSVHDSSHPAVWMYGEFVGLPGVASNLVCPLLSQRQSSNENILQLDVKRWVMVVLNILEHGTDWEVYSYTIVHIGAQLANRSLFGDMKDEMEKLRALVVSQITTTKVHRPPTEAGLKQADVAVCLCSILTVLIAYREHFDLGGLTKMVNAFKIGLTAWDKTTIPCVHAITVCCYEWPEVMWRHIFPIVSIMSTMVTKKDAAIHLLEFLAGLSRLPHLLQGFDGEDIKVVFGVCDSYIKYAREKRFDDARRRARVQTLPTSSGRQIGSLGAESLVRRPATVTPTPTGEIPQYVFTLAYNVMTFYFLGLREDVREKYYHFLKPKLLAVDEEGKREDQALVVLDFIWRVTTRGSPPNDLDQPFIHAEDAASWTSQFSVLNIACHEDEGVARFDERRASGVDHWTVPLNGCRTPQEVYAKHIEGVPSGPFSEGWELSPLPAIDVTKRAVYFLDRSPAIDFYKVGVMFIGEDQVTEADILANRMGSPDYNHLLAGLGERLDLIGAKHNTMGLDTVSEADGDYTIWYRDSVTALIYHVTTYMPTNVEADPACIRKKAHVGNDFVNIVFNNSSMPFEFNTFPSAFNYVYIVVTPVARASFVETRTRSQEPGWYEETWYKLQVLTRADFPLISSAGNTKVVSGRALASYVRNLALNACVFCNVWAAREGGAQPQSWKARLVQLHNIKERYG